ncbi:hypothetical protein NLG97_g3410 [Lecanicillium saksenae]|uniref:Uncharacterized protein n=1 Tax=Lecanicillium saksenae TaxID=468837 RepID=A0ACC1QZK9_9HYPO|nr:hypothetical protein NLG97_g3410 [Lecanicillium saksenae]
MAPTGYAFLWQCDASVPYKPDERLINVTALVKTAEVSRARLSYFLKQTPEITKAILGGGGSIVHGTYVSYEAAEDVCAHFGLNPTPVRDLAANNATNNTVLD